MKITFLGTGTSQGIPVIGCTCPTCRSTYYKDKRLRSSILIEEKNTHIVIDAGPDFRQQMLTHQVNKLDAILLTHEHIDHTGGLDDIRSYNYLQKQYMSIYCEKRVEESLKKEYFYVFENHNYPGIPKFNIIEIDETPFYINNIKIIPIRILHKELPILGFRINNFAYITDGKTIPEKEYDKLKGLDILVINALRKKDHHSHFTLEEALMEIEKISPHQAYITHISHLMGTHKENEKLLPRNVKFAYDGLKIIV